MKKVFLLGDSIRIGYDEFVRELLKGTADVFYPEDNGRFAGYTYVCIPQWKNLAGDPDQVNVVHWNCGHWDCAHFYRDSEPYSTVEEYAAWLERVHRAIVKHFPNAQIVFATTTLVDMTRYPAMANRRSNDEIRAYNDAALRVMNGLGVTVNDLAGLSSRFSSSYYADAVHMNEDGYRALAAQVADMIARHLDKR